LHLVADDRVWTGFAAFRAMVLLNPVAYSVALVVLLAAAHAGLSNWLLATLLVLFAPLLTPVGEAVYDWVARNRHRIPPRTCRTPETDAPERV
jgi:predicted DCC family thiol-disulfide oxidoreductase YuxK